MTQNGCGSSPAPARKQAKPAKAAQDYRRDYVKTGQNAYTFAWLRYLMYIPKDYPQQITKKYPCILYLHALGQKGSDPWALAQCCLNKQLQPTIKDSKGKDVPNPGAKKDFPFIVVSPQLPGDIDWSVWPGPNMNRSDWWNDYMLKAIDKLLDHLIEHYAIDVDRIYCTGPSMGGYGVWKMAVKYPQRFAAVSPQCGEGDPAEAARLKDVPVWIFHGNCDEYMPVGNSDDVVAALKAAGCEVKYTRWACEKDSAACIECEKQHYGDFAAACASQCMECNHFKCYENQFDELYSWLLTKHR
jgi:predicted peptidase